MSTPAGLPRLLLTAALLACPPAALADPLWSVDPYFSAGYDFGFTTAARLTFTDGSSEDLKANQGAVVSAGVTTLRAYDGLLETRLTVGVKYDKISGGGAAIEYLAIPFELVEHFNLAPFRLGAGLSVALAPRIEGSGGASAIDVHLQPSVGLLLEARYVFEVGGSKLGLGPRLLWQRLKWPEAGTAIAANAIGLSLDFTP